MAANDPQPRPDRAGRRRFITRTHVEDAARSGSAVHVGGRDVVTDEAAQRAEDLGVRIVREQAAPSRAADAPMPGGAAPAPAPDELRAAVRRAVVAELGREPEGLTAAIDKAMRRRGH
ncbi:hypothetical protein GA707_12050 [Nostocoides sp. F2B08]|uniref:hypothetical protein n=1 Tax=Nostocoides sp. F2B08 TaxID=2653936 RepID=UPI0012638BA3|nr:hypothetical protein [Tetrasphaera sp. F2B08]KAB7744172.1 hypothetical protein GA707_12050 [Tetrasphaera sp. F2B08]